MEGFDKIPEHLKCPICMEVPKSQVLQCRKGHYLCETRYSRLSQCPQCRIPFNNENIRNLYIEMMLDKLSTDCPYKNSGCKVKVNRKTNMDHLEKCYFNLEKFGPFVHVCNAIGLPTCSFKMNRGNIAQSIRHFKLIHGAWVRDSDSVVLEFIDYVNFSGGTKPIILNQREEGYAFIILATHQPQTSRLSWAAYYLRYPRERSSMNADLPPLTFKVECGVKDQPLKWSTFPVDILNNKYQEHFYWTPTDMALCESKDGQTKSLIALVNVRKLGKEDNIEDSCLEGESTLILSPHSIPNAFNEATQADQGKVNEETTTTNNVEGDPMTIVTSSVSGLSLTATKIPCPYDKLSEHLKCPICRKVPKGQIFQCTEGHHLCAECYPKSSICTRCHAAFPFTRIRTLVVEAMLDELTLECPYQNSGCKETMSRQCLEDHRQVCRYNFARFGPFVSICESIGLGNCPFKANRGSAVEAINHFEGVHGATTVTLDRLDIEFTDFSLFSGGSKPIVLNREEEGYAFLILVTPDAGILSWTAYFLRYIKPGGRELAMLSPVPYQMDFTLNGRYTMTWTTTPKDLFTCWVNTACLIKSDKITMDPTRCMDKDNQAANVFVQVKVFLSEEVSEIREKSGPHLILTPFSIPNISVEAASGTTRHGSNTATTNPSSSSGTVGDSKLITGTAHSHNNLTMLRRASAPSRLTGISSEAPSLLCKLSHSLRYLGEHEWQRSPLHSIKATAMSTESGPLPSNPLREVGAESKFDADDESHVEPPLPTTPKFNFSPWSKFWSNPAKPATPAESWANHVKARNTLVRDPHDFPSSLPSSSSASTIPTIPEFKSNNGNSLAVSKKRNLSRRLNVTKIVSPNAAIHSTNTSSSFSWTPNLNFVAQSQSDKVIDTIGIPGEDGVGKNS